MSQDTQKPAPATQLAPAQAPAPAAAEVPVEKPVAKKEVTALAAAASEAAPAVTVEKEPAPVPAPETVPEPEPVEAEKTAETVEALPETTAAEVVQADKKIIQSASFKEESNVASELPEAQRKALEELKELVREALNKHEFTAPPPPPPAPAKEEETAQVAEEEKKEEKTEEKVEGEVKGKEMKEEEKKEVKEETKEEKKDEVKEEKKEEKKDEVKEEKEEEKKEEKTEERREEKKEEEKKEVTGAEKRVAEAKPEGISAATETITIEKAFAADEDGAKTVEAIEETIIPVSAPEAPKEAETPLEPEEVSIWGIPLLQDQRSDVVLLKFLRARDFKVKEAFSMLKNTVRWRKDFKIDEVLEEDFGNEFENMAFIHGVDKLGHPVCYNSYNEFQNKELFADKEKRAKFLRWRIQFHEKCVRALDFSPNAKSSFVNISDFRNAPGLGKRALWQFIKQAVKVFEDNYPEFVAKELFINVPWWYIPYYRTIGSLTSPRTTSKMVLAGPTKSADAIFKYIAPEQVPVKYGGLSSDGEQEFGYEDSVTEVIIKPAAKHAVDLPATEACTLVWELRVLGSEVSYGAQFEPSTEGSYTVIVSKTRKIGLTDEPVITDSFKVGEPGKVVVTIDNQTSRKKKLLYRFKTKPRCD